MAEFRYNQTIFLRFTVTLFHSNLDEKITSNEQKVTTNEQKVQPRSALSHKLSHRSDRAKFKTGLKSFLSYCYKWRH